MPLVLDGTNGVSGVDGTASNPAIEGTDSNTGIFYPAADTVAIGTGGTERLRVDSAGNAGLGVTPSAWASGWSALQISSSTSSLSAKANNGVYFTYNGYNNNTNWLYSATGQPSGAYAIVNPAGNIEHRWFNAASGTAGNAITFTQAMTLDASGNLGIGTTSPSHLLQATKNQNATTRIAVTNSDTTNTSSRAAFQAVSGTVNCDLTAIQSLGAYLGTSSNHELNFVTNGSTRATITTGGDLSVGGPGPYIGERFNAVSTSNNPAMFGYNAGTSYTGQVVVAQTETAPTTSWMYYQGRSAGGGVRVNIYGNGNIQNTNNSYGALSDERIKENIVDATPKLEKLNQVRIVNFNIKGDEQKQIGVIAQELEQIFPSMVEEDGEGMKGVKYSVFVPMLIKAIQELKAELDATKAEVAALKGNA